MVKHGKGLIAALAFGLSALVLPAPVLAACGDEVTPEDSTCAASADASKARMS